MFISLQSCTKKKKKWFSFEDFEWKKRMNDERRAKENIKPKKGVVHIAEINNI